MGLFQAERDMEEHGKQCIKCDMYRHMDAHNVCEECSQSLNVCRNCGENELHVYASGEKEQTFCHGCLVGRWGPCGANFKCDICGH